MRIISAKIFVIFLLCCTSYWSNTGLYARAINMNELASQESIQTIDSTVSELVYTPQGSSETIDDQSENDILTLAVITKNNTLKIVGESNAASVVIIIKDSSFVVIKQINTDIVSGRFEWSDSLPNYTPEETYYVTVTDNNGNTTSEAVVLPVEEDDYILNLAVLTNDRTLTVAGESSCASVEISIKNSRFVEIENITENVENGRFEWSDSISKFTPETSYRVTVTDAQGHTASDTVIIPVKDDIYTLTVSVSTRDEQLRIVGESSARSVKINIKNDNLIDVYKGRASGNNGIYSWSQPLSKFEEDETYKIIVTDRDEHTVTEQVTIPISVKGIEFGEFEKKLEVGKSLSITATVIPGGAQNQIVRYSSSNDSIATVSSSGKVTGHSAGKVTVTASAGSASADTEITVYVKTHKIELNENFLTMLPNMDFQITTEVFPKTAEQKCTYTSTNETVITVTAGGKTTAKNSGVASVIVSNGDISRIVTVVVNNGSTGKLGGLSESYSSSETEHIENSQLASIIHSNDIKQVVLHNTDLSLLDTSALFMLKKEKKDLIVDKGKYLILIQGKAIANPENTLSVDIPIEYVENKIKFVVNDGQLLPGKITIQLRDKGVFTKKYLYLYNQIKNKYETIDSFNIDDKSIYIDKGGTYLLTEKKLAKYPINLAASAVAGSGCVVMGAVYVVIKRRYWFY